MQFEAANPGEAHLDGVRRGAVFAACLILALMCIWPWSAVRASNDLFTNARSLAARAADIANAPATAAQPWLPAALTARAFAE